ncbi:MAG: hypothetical protein AB7H77_09595 [Bdellovibrionales bacterium]
MSEAEHLKRYQIFCYDEESSGGAYDYVAAYSSMANAVVQAVTFAEQKKVRNWHIFDAVKEYVVASGVVPK